MKSPLPRLSVLLASEAPVGVIFRRGPSKLVQVIIWNRKNDTFKLGSRFKGRIYPESSDLSPDGRRLLYFAMGGLAWAIPETRGTWTAISELPALRATAIWGQGDTRGGGGMFLSNKVFWLDAAADTFLIRDQSGLRRETYGSKLPFRNRWERDGWTQKGRTIEKQITPKWILRQTKTATCGYELESAECKLTFPTWQWADWDRDRLVFAEDGCLKKARLGKEKLTSIRTLQDFSLPI